MQGCSDTSFNTFHMPIIQTLRVARRLDVRRQHARLPLRHGSILEICGLLITACVRNLRCGRAAEAILEAVRCRRRAAQRARQALHEGVTEAHPARPARVDLQQQPPCITITVPVAHAPPLVSLQCRTLHLTCNYKECDALRGPTASGTLLERLPVGRQPYNNWKANRWLDQPNS